jgi:hypothetical protein
VTDKELMEQLEAERDNLSTRIFALYHKIKYAEADRYTGKYFRKADSYGSSEADDHIFYIYLKVIEVTKTGDIRVIRFEDDPRGRIEINLYKRCPAGSLEDAEEITQEHFEAAWDRCLLDISEHLPIQPRGTR